MSTDSSLFPGGCHAFVCPGDTTSTIRPEHDDTVDSDGDVLHQDREKIRILITSDFEAYSLAGFTVTLSGATVSP
mgnify:FL=1